MSTWTIALVLFILWVVLPLVILGWMIRHAPQEEDRG